MNFLCVTIQLTTFDRSIQIFIGVKCTQIAKSHKSFTFVNAIALDRHLIFDRPEQKSLVKMCLCILFCSLLMFLFFWFVWYVHFGILLTNKTKKLTQSFSAALVFVVQYEKKNKTNLRALKFHREISRQICYQSICFIITL